MGWENFSHIDFKDLSSSVWKKLRVDLTIYSFIIVFRQPLWCQLEETLCMFDDRDEKFCESTIYFFIAETCENFRPCGILHLEHLLLLDVSGTFGLEL